jgi:CRISPR-associated endonuclease/helicase Cas3
MDFIAKTDGTTLEEHVNHVIRECEDILSNHAFVVNQYKEVAKNDISDCLRQAAKFHDEGKKDERWQKAIKKDQKAVKNGEREYNLRNVGFRHEIQSLIRCRDLNFSDRIKTAIGAHHGKLSFNHEHRWKDNAESLNIWKSFRKLDGKLWPRKFKEALLEHYKYAGPRSYLQLADHRASGKESGNRFPAFKSFLYNFPSDWIKRPVQEIAVKYWKDDLLLIRAPTGSGKTDASLLWAKKQIENNRADRLVIAMPTRFTSNALEIGITENLSSTGLYHSTAAFSKYKIKSSRFKKTERDKYNRLDFARLLETPVTVCTIDHLLMALTLTMEDHHGILFNLAHSCLVIDEADFYDDFTQANILVLLKALNILKVPVLIMSASLPTASTKMYQNTGFTTTEIKEDKSDYERPRCSIKSFDEYEKVEKLEILLKECLKKPAIIYANTIDKAIEFYKWFDKRNYKDATIYHSRFTEPDKIKKEKELIEKLGENAWKNDNAHGIAIMTQIGEMSVNISADLMLTDLCPIDRLVQRIGRLSRFQTENFGDVHILIPIKKENLYPAPYGNFNPNKREWKASKALLQTDELIMAKEYTAMEFVDLVDQVYSEVQNFSPLAEDNARKLENLFINNWLILPKQESKLDDTNVNFWRSRNIPSQTTIFTKHPYESFNSWVDYQNYKNKYSIKCPNYLVKKGLNNETIFRSSILIGDVEESIYHIIDGYYNSQIGLNFSGKRKTDDQIIDIG